MNRHDLEGDYKFTPSMRDKLSRLKALVASGQAGDDFPWAEYHDLQGRESRNIPESQNIPKRSLIVPAFNSKGASSIEDVSKPRKMQLASAQKTSSPTAASTALADSPVASQASAPAKTSKDAAPLIQKMVAPSLESLCQGRDDKQKSEYAAKIDGMWEAVKNKTIASSYPTACAAVYKLAEWLGVVHKDIKSRDWKAMLVDRYQVAVSEAIGKYQFQNPPKSRVFWEAVRNAFAFAQQNWASKAKQNPLPGIYQQLPVYTKNGKGLGGQ